MVNTAYCISKQLYSCVPASLYFCQNSNLCFSLCNYFKAIPNFICLDFRYTTLLLHILMPTENTWIILPIFISSTSFYLFQEPDKLYRLYSSLSCYPSYRTSLSLLSLQQTSQTLHIYFSAGTTVWNKHKCLTVLHCLWSLVHIARAIQNEQNLLWGSSFLDTFWKLNTYYHINHPREHYRFNNKVTALHVV